jgi:hypothetical protein
MTKSKFFQVSFIAAAMLGSSAMAADLKPATGERVAPAEYANFQSVLSQSKLQASDPEGKPGNKKEYALDSNFTGLVSEHFYVDKGAEALVFSMKGYKNRSELRVLDNFKTDLPNTFYHFSADLLPINPLAAMQNSDAKNKEMTFMQVHNAGTKNEKRGQSGEGYIPHPLIRIVYEAERDGKKDNYWAIIKNNAIDCGSKSGNKGSEACNTAYVKFNLGPMDPAAPTHFEIIVGNSQLVVKVNGQAKVEHDISYWKDLFSYFKAGVYNQFKKGTSEVRFYNLQYSIEKK